MKGFKGFLNYVVLLCLSNLLVDVWVSLCATRLIDGKLCLNSICFGLIG